ncbi:protein jim lovell isoform X2 [Ceratitis capitata]|uniref:protein jim lovell isoform X2 n=1 Tax=Ceratitis capitata TaxID=7213 RepID=UPI000329E42F|nr:protein jim lovell isoform X2 [Ceratitis capitata]
MLMEPMHGVKRRKSSVSHSHNTASIATTPTSMENDSVATTPPITPPTPPLNMMMTTARNHSSSSCSASSLIGHGSASSTCNMGNNNTTCTLTAASSAPTHTTDTPSGSLLSASQQNASASSATAAAAIAAAAAAAVAAVAAAGTNASTTSALITTAPATTNAIAAPLQDHYSLRWNNHQNHILRAFDALLQTKTLVDVTLVCAETSIHAHKMVLSACSPFFQRVFAETPCKHPVIVLKDFQGWVVQAIVDFMYRGEISVQQERLQTLIQAGESLQVRGLVESSVPEHTPTPAASPDDFGMIDTSLMSPELERCSSFDEESPSMVTAGSKVILPSRLFGSSARRERERERKRERALERELEREIESDQDLPLDTSINSDMCTSPMPRRKQARPRRRSGDLPLEMINEPVPPAPATAPIKESPQTQPLPLTLEEQLEKAQADSIEALKTVIKTELAEPVDEDEGARRDGSGNANDSHENNESQEKSSNEYQPSEEQQQSCGMVETPSPATPLNAAHSTHSMDIDDEEQDDENENEHENGNDDVEPIPDAEDIEELINATNELRRKSLSNLSEGPEDLCTTKKDQNETGGSKSANDTDNTPANNNNNNNKLNNNNRIVLSLKDIRQLNKPSSSSAHNSANNMHPFATASLRDLRLDRAVSTAAENQCKIDALEAQMHAAASAAAAAAVNGENPFQLMEHQMDLSLAAAAAAAAVSHQQSRERDHALQREQREFQEQQNAYANSILGQMGMAGMPPFGPPVGPGGPAPHERLEESMNRLSKEFDPTSPMSLPPHFNPTDGPPHPSSPLPFPVFGLDSPLGLFPPGIDPGKLYNPLMEMSDPRGMPSDHPPPFLKGKKIPRPKGQHSAPRGGPPRSWTNSELTEALQHVWNKKMTTSQASRIFGIPYNSLLMYVRGKYGKSLKLEQLRKDCISGPPLELLQLGLGGSGGGGKHKEGKNKSSAHHNADNTAKGNAELDLGIPLPGMVPGGNGANGPRSASSEPDLLGGPNSIFGPFPGAFYPEFPGGFPGLPLSMLNLLPPTDRHQPHAAGLSALHHLGMDEDCKSDRSKQSSSLGDDDFAANAALGAGMQPLALNRSDSERRGSSDMLANSNSLGAPPPPPPPMNAAVGGGGAQQNGGMQD